MGILLAHVAVERGLRRRGRLSINLLVDEPIVVVIFLLSCRGLHRCQQVGIHFDLLAVVLLKLGLFICTELVLGLSLLQRSLLSVMPMMAMLLMLSSLVLVPASTDKTNAKKAKLVI